MSPEVLRPKLMLASGVLHVRMDLGDVLAADALRAMAVRARTAPFLVTVPAVRKHLLMYFT